MSDPKPTAPTSVLAGDDRNIVAVGDQTPGLSLEDHLFLFWTKYKTPVIAASLALIAVVGAKTSYDAYLAAKEQGIRNDFAAIDGVAGYPAFVQANPDHPLAAVAQLRIGDDHFANQKYAEAAAAYEAAAGKLPSSDHVGARARLSAAMALLFAKQTDAGRTKLAALADDAAAPLSFRSQAAYQHAVSLGESGDIAGLQNWIEKLNTIDPDGAWSQRAQNLKRVATAPGATTKVEVTPAPAVAAPAAPAAIAAPATTTAPAAESAAPAIEFKPKQ